MKTIKLPGDIVRYILDVVVIFFQGKIAPIQPYTAKINK